MYWAKVNRGRRVSLCHTSQHLGRQQWQRFRLLTFRVLGIKLCFCGFGRQIDASEECEGLFSSAWLVRPFLSRRWVQVIVDVFHATYWIPRARRYFAYGMKFVRLMSV